MKNIFLNKIFCYFFKANYYNMDMFIPEVYTYYYQLDYLNQPFQQDWGKYLT